MHFPRARSFAGAWRWLSLVLAVVLLLESAESVLAAPAQPGVNSGQVAPAPTLRDCSAVAEGVLQSEVNLVTQQVFTQQLQALDFAPIVQKHWADLRMDAAVNDAVDQAVLRVQGETDLWNKFLSGWSPDKAKELTLAVATYAFDSPAFRTKVDGLAAAVTDDVAGRLAAASADSASAALYCLQTFIGHNYSKALVAAFQDRVEQATSSSAMPDVAKFSPDLLALVGQHQVALGGVGVIIAAQVARRVLVSITEDLSETMAHRIAVRIIGRAGASVIPLAGWLIGGGLIAYDLYSNRDGALPQIQSSIKGDETKNGIRSQIAGAIQPELSMAAPTLARSIANDLFAEWRNTKRSIGEVLDLSAQNPQFAALLAGLQKPDEVARLVQLVGAVQQQGGAAAVDQAVASGALAKVVNLPAGATVIATETGSLQQAIDWAAKAGSRLDQVVAMELFKQITPEKVKPAALDQLVALGDKTAAARLLALAPAAQDTLLALPGASVVKLAAQLSPDELTWLADALPTLAPALRTQLVARIASQPAIVPSLQALGDLRQLAAAGNLDQAISFVSGPKDLAAYWGDAADVISGAASPGLFSAKHGVWPTAGAAAMLLLLVLLLLRLAYSLGAWLVQPLTLVARLRR